jgi:threonylcarbamoyladenosine tRNA methylthiotransferase MtaB
MKVSILTLGCRVNQSESSVIEESLKQNGVNIVDLNDNPDYCIVNTCTVTRKSDYNSRQIIRKAARKGAKVIVTGCYSQLHVQEVAALPAVFRRIDINNKFDIIALITEEQTKPSFGVTGRARPYLKVQDGCNFSCSYCTVPLARGKSRSVPVNLLVERANSIVEKGFSEIVLTGVHLGTYGQDLPSSVSIAGLVKTLLSQTSIHRIRLSSLEINEVSDELLELLKEKRLCRNLHVPLQSGSDKILRLMRRGYTPSYFMKKIEAIASKLGDIGLGTDVIVGFPGEGADEFNETRALIDTLPFTYLHVFPYSPRPDTDASVMPGRPQNSVVRERTELLRELGNAKKTMYMTKHIGRNLEIIIDEGACGDSVFGTSSNYLKISVPAYPHQRGSIDIAQPLGLKKDHLEGVLVKDC